MKNDVANPTDRPVRALVTADTGSGDPTYLFVHGIGVSSRYFERLIPVTARRARVVAVDLPGFGKNPKPPHPLTVEDYAETVADVIDRLGIGGCVVVGHSMGTQVATHLAITRPDAVGGLALIGPVMDPQDRNALRAAMLLGRDTLGESLRGNWVVFSDYLRCGIRWYSAVLPSMLAYRTEDALPLVACPVLVIRGENDPIARDEWVTALAAAAPVGAARAVPRARHLAMHAQPEITDALLTALTRRAG